jgi:hypothetical protein
LDAYVTFKKIDRGLMILNEKSLSSTCTLPYTTLFHIKNHFLTQNFCTMARFPDAIIFEAYSRQNGLCGDCGDSLEDVIWQGHHLLRVADGGSHNINNCVLLCFECHHAAHNYGQYRQPLETFAESYDYFFGSKKYSRKMSR